MKVNVTLDNVPQLLQLLLGKQRQLELRLDALRSEPGADPVVIEALEALSVLILNVASLQASRVQRVVAPQMIAVPGGRS